MADTVQDYTKNGVPPYVWMSPVHTQHKESLRLRGCPYAPTHLDAHMFGCPPVCLDAPICLDVPVCLGAPYV